MPRFVVATALVALTSAAGTPVVAGEIAPPMLNAQYVALGYELGNGVLSASDAITANDTVTPEDRQVMEDVRRQVEAWDRFVIVDRVDHADLVIAVRAGRRGTLAIGVSSRSAGATLSSPDDILSVYEAQGSEIPLWRRHAPEGLSAELPLLQAFRDELEAASPN
jgi:hypothetical protein